MEPMTLGSPAGSPAPEQYLPCFLLGDNTFSQTPRRNRLSPIQDRSLAFGNIRSPSSLSSSINNESEKQKSVQSIKFGPPIIDLYDDMPTTYKLPPDAFTPDSLLKRDPVANQKDSNRSIYSPEYNSPLNGSMPYQFNTNNTFNNTSMTYKSPQFMNSHMSAAEVFSNSNNVTSPVYGSKRPYPYNDTFQSTYDTSIMSNNYSGRFMEQEFWVTVFGFMPEMHLEVTSFFQSVGNIIDKYMKPDCNYICLKYTSRLEARQVLAYNGYLLKPGIIIGVMLCDNPELVGRDMSSIANSDYENKAKLERLRLLSQSSMRLSPPIVHPAKKKKKDNGLVGKAIDYIMGW